MSPTTNLDMKDLEDAIVEKCETHPELEKRVFAVVSPLIEIESLSNLPLVFVAVTSERESSEAQPLGQKLRRKVEPIVEITIAAQSLSVGGGRKEFHGIAAILKDLLMGWTPDLEDIHRPMVYEDGNQLEHDEEGKIITWVMTWSTMTIVKEV
jgi:hypothetical protein